MFLGFFPSVNTIGHSLKVVLIERNTKLNTKFIAFMTFSVLLFGNMRISG